MFIYGNGRILNLDTARPLIVEIYDKDRKNNLTPCPATEKVEIINSKKGAAAPTIVFAEISVNRGIPYWTMGFCADEFPKLNQFDIRDCIVKAIIQFIESGVKTVSIDDIFSNAHAICAELNNKEGER